MLDEIDPTVPASRLGGTTECVAASFQVNYRHYLDCDGQPIESLPPFASDPETLIPLYRMMVLTRTFDAKAVSLQRTGQLGTYPSSLGQEAVAVGFASVMSADDVLVPSYREHGAQLWRGVSMTELFQFWSGDERGSDYAGPRQDFPVSIPIASHAPHAVGVAAAMKLRGEARACVCALGDGATSKGDFYEALNVAGVWRLGVVFIVTNNQWAISLPRREQTASETIAQKAIAAGFEGLQVDGNDIIAVRQAAFEALERARSGQGPSLIEAITYRLGDHTTADDARRYRSEQDVSAHWKKEPVARLRSYLAANGWWKKADEEALLRACKADVEAAKDAYLAIEPQPPKAMFEHLFETPPESLRSQRELVEDQPHA